MPLTHSHQFVRSEPFSAAAVASDDVVIAESPAQLAGWLRKSLP